jgi:hypothetical protein
MAFVFLGMKYKKDWRPGLWHAYDLDDIDSYTKKFDMVMFEDVEDLFVERKGNPDLVAVLRTIRESPVRMAGDRRGWIRQKSPGEKWRRLTPHESRIIPDSSVRSYQDAYDMKTFLNRKLEPIEMPFVTASAPIVRKKATT